MMMMMRMKGLKRMELRTQSRPLQWSWQQG
jgi:hypothetical protein